MAEPARGPAVGAGRHRRQVRRLLGAVLAGAALCAQAAGTLTVCTGTAPGHFDIAQLDSPALQEMAGLPLYDQLLQRQPGSATPQPGLATAWQTSADGLVVTLTLRRDVAFHDTPWFHPTRALDADDVVFSLNRLNDPTHSLHAVAPQGYAAWQRAGLPALIQGVARVDAGTVRITLRRPAPGLPALLALPALGSVFSAEYAAQRVQAGRTGDLATQPVGTGPFLLQRHEPGRSIRYTAHAGHWRGAPRLDALVFTIDDDPDALAGRLAAGTCQALGPLDADAAAQARDSGAGLLRSRGWRTDLVVPNGRHRFLSDPRLRTALRLALDRAGLVQSVYRGQAEPATAVLPPGLLAGDRAPRERRDLARARALVRASGYDGRELRLLAPLAARAAAQRLQADWARIGVPLSVQALAPGELRQRSARGEYDLLWLGQRSDDGDAGHFLAQLLGCAAPAGADTADAACPPAIDALLQSARQASDAAQRDALLRQALQRLHDDALLIPIAHPLDLLALSPRLRGVASSPLGTHDFSAATLR